MRGQLATRLSCFAILSAVETDLRSAIEDCVDAARIVEPLPEDVRQNALARWERDVKAGSGGSSDQTLGSDIDVLHYTDFADMAAESVAQSKPPDPIVFAEVQRRLRELRTLVQEGRIQR